MEFRVSKHSRAGLQLHAKPPPQCSRLLLQGGIATYTSFAGGAVLTQVLRGDLFTATSHHFFVTAQELQLWAYTGRPLCSLNYTLAGQADCILAPGQEVCLHAGWYQLFYVPPGIPHAVRLKGHFSCFHIEPEPALLAQMGGNDPRLSPLLAQLAGAHPEGLPYHAACMNRKIKTLVGDILSRRHPDTGHALLFLNAQVYQLLRLCARDLKQMGKRSAAQFARRQQWDEVRDYIGTQLHTPLPLPALARRFGLSVIGLHRLSQRFTGMPPGAYILSRRMALAAELLEQDMPISEVMMKTGFENRGGFQRAFTRHFAYPPGKWHKQE